MRPFLLIGPVVLCLTAACSSSQGLRVESLNEILDREAARFAGDRSLQSDRAPPATFPPTLGLYLKPTGFLQRAFEWTDQDRDRILTWGKELASRGFFAGAAFVSHSSLKNDNLAELRTAAARYGADLLLVVDGAAAVDRYNNYKAPLLYWTILGAYLADGTHSDALCLLRADLWDIKTGAPLFSERAEATTRRVGPAAFIDDRTGVERARELALDKLLTLVAQRLEPTERPRR